MGKDPLDRPDNDEQRRPEDDLGQAFEKFSGLPGEGDPGQGDLFECPVCHDQWRRNFVGEEIPTCAKDHRLYKRV